MVVKKCRLIGPPLCVSSSSIASRIKKMYLDSKGNCVLPNPEADSFVVKDTH